MDGSSRKEKRDSVFNRKRLLQDEVLDQKLPHGADGEGHGVPQECTRTKAGRADGQVDKMNLGPQGGESEGGTGESDVGASKPGPSVEGDGERHGGPRDGAVGGDGGDVRGEKMRLVIGRTVEGISPENKPNYFFQRGKVMFDKVAYRGLTPRENVLMGGGKPLVLGPPVPEPSTRRRELIGLCLSEEKTVGGRRDEQLMKTD